MHRRTALLAGAGLLSAASRVASQPPALPRVVFLNPGEPVERGKGPHWLMTARLMAAAAKTFGMQLEVLVGGTGGWPHAPRGLAEGGLAATLGSHFFIEAWAMVPLHDYHHGVDFAAHGGVTQKLDYMHVINCDNAPRYVQAVYKRDVPPDLSVYSKVLHPRAGRCDFNLAPLLRNT